jgi:hypothetical protein
MIIALNIVLAAVVVIGIVGMLAFSIATQNGEPAGDVVRLALRRRRRRAGARARVLGRTVAYRA